MSLLVTPVSPSRHPREFDATRVRRTTVLIVPGLRDAVVGHWQTLLHARLLDAGRSVRSVLPMSRDDLALEPRLAAIEREAHAIHGPIVVVAHSGGCIALAHWARRTTRSVHGALLAAPPEFDRALPEGYPSIDELRAAGWLAVPREPLPFPSIVAASRTDPLARFEGIEALAHAWGSRLVDLGDAGHLNPASGYGPWPRAEDFIRELAQAETEEPAR